MTVASGEYEINAAVLLAALVVATLAGTVEGAGDTAPAMSLLPLLSPVAMMALVSISGDLFATVEWLTVDNRLLRIAGLLLSDELAALLL